MLKKGSVTLYIMVWFCGRKVSQMHQPNSIYTVSVDILRRHNDSRGKWTPNTGETLTINGLNIL